MFHRAHLVYRHNGNIFVELERDVHSSIIHREVTVTVCQIDQHPKVVALDAIREILALPEFIIEGVGVGDHGGEYWYMTG